MNKERFCKCGHNKKIHKKEFLSNTGFCNKCHCNEYMNNNAPTLIDGIFLVVAIITLSTLAITTIFLAYVTYSGFGESLSKPIEGMTVGEVLGFLFICMFLVLLLLFMLFDEPIFGYFRQRRRPKFEVEE